VSVKFGKFVLLAASTALAVVGLGGPAAAQTTPQAQPSIIGGSTASSGPWAARLFVNGQQNCTATIIAPQYILGERHLLAARQRR
jgi:secreted trypsin-like serine protease